MEESGVVAVVQADEDDGDEAILVEDLEPLDATAVVEGEPLVLVAEESIPPPSPPPTESSALPPAPDEPFTVFLCTLADIAIGAGSPEVASILPALLLDGRLEHDLAAETAAALADAGIAKDGAVSPAFVAQTHAWRAILRGTSDDFAACGGAMLDEWAADLLACLFGARARATTLRRDLRARGIAAFGLVEAA